MIDSNDSEAELRAALATVAVPDLSPGFEARLHRRLETRRGRWLLAAYWNVAGAASLWILLRLDWSWSGLLALAAVVPFFLTASGWRLLAALGRLMYPPRHVATPGDA
jgi:hypothetical protein